MDDIKLNDNKLMILLFNKVINTSYTWVGFDSFKREQEIIKGSKKRSRAFILINYKFTRDKNFFSNFVFPCIMF